MSFPACSLPEFLKIPVTHQKNLVIIIPIIIIIILSSNPTKSQSVPASPTDDISNSPEKNFRPSLAVVIGVLAIMFTLTLFLLVYAKWCHRPSSPQYLNQENLGGLANLASSASRVSGIDKTVIESLPNFRFSTLKGCRNGLECSICLSRFEDVEVLRLLPKCKHAFHIDCVDKWLERHSGCPLCRCKVREEDVTLFAYSSSFRFVNNLAAACENNLAVASEGSNLELYVEREGSARFGSRRSGHKIEQEKYDQEILEDEGMLHKFNHRIIISYFELDLMGKNRWSSLSSSDLLFLKSEMVTSLSSNLFQDNQETVASMPSNSHNHDLDHQVINIKEEIKRKREFEKKIKKFPGGEPGVEVSNELKSAKLVEKRSMSEIVVHPRFLGVEGSSNKEGNLGEMSTKEERLKRIWLPIATRTIQMFANRDQQQTRTRSQV